MILDAPDFLLYIEPARETLGSAVVDADAVALFRALTSEQVVRGIVTDDNIFHPDVFSKGRHCCGCGPDREIHDFFTGESLGLEATGPESASHDVQLSCGLVTNTLSLHYLVFHRSAVPTSELSKLARISRGSKLSPTEEKEFMELATTGQISQKKPSATLKSVAMVNPSDNTDQDGPAIMESDE